MALTKESKKYESISKRIKKWVKNKPSSDYDNTFIPAKNTLEEYLKEDWNSNNLNLINRIVKIHSAIGAYGYWYYCCFLENLFISENVEKIWEYWRKGAEFRILQYSLGYKFPQNISPIDDGKIALSICDSIIFNNDLGRYIIDGYICSKKEIQPQRNPHSVIQYACSIYNRYYNNNKNNISTEKMLTLYSDLFYNIESPNDLFAKYFEKACEFHLERSKNSMLYEFSWEEDMIIPSELLATLLIRKKLGLTNENVCHPIIMPFLSFLKLEKNSILIDSFEYNLIQKIKKDFLLK